MNELIQKFVKQSTHKILGVDQVDQAEFAELIVAECVKVFGENLPNPGEGMLDVVNRICAVSDHFGFKVKQ